MQSESHHAQALRPMPGSPLELALLQARRSPDGGVQYSQDGRGVEAQQGDARVLLTWAFGAGVQGMTATGTIQGVPDETAVEHRFSLYTKTQGLGVTFGHPSHVSTPLGHLGVLQDSRTIARCFSCHSTSDAGEPLETDKRQPIEAGVRCERCHGPGAGHIAAARSQLPPGEIQKAIFNPARFPARAQVQICAACHRLPMPDSGDEPELADPVTIRFAPVGLMASRCFRESKTLSCLTCHNPHTNVVPASDLTYRDKCLTCHSSLQNVKWCRRVERANCLPCHMQKVTLSASLTFTDHRIRVFQSQRPAIRTLREVDKKRKG